MDSETEARCDRRRSTTAITLQERWRQLVTPEGEPPARGQTLAGDVHVAVYTLRTRTRNRGWPPRGGPPSRRAHEECTHRPACLQATRPHRSCAVRPCVHSAPMNLQFICLREVQSAFVQANGTIPRGARPLRTDPVARIRTRVTRFMTRRSQRTLAGICRCRLRRTDPNQGWGRAHLRGLLRRHVLEVSCALPRFHLVSFHGFLVPFEAFLPTSLPACAGHPPPAPEGVVRVREIAFLNFGKFIARMNVPRSGSVRVGSRRLPFRFSGRSR